MSRFKPFVILDILMTLPLFMWATYETLKAPHDGFEVAVLAGAVVVMLPSMICLFGWTLGQITAVAFILFYLFVLAALWLRIMSGWQELHHATLIRIGIFLLVAKSIYGVVSITKRDA